MKAEPRIRRGRLARRRGYFAESIAALCLRLKGYRVIERNWRSTAGEIDILASRGRLLVLVEVKYRADAALAGAALGVPQRRRLVRALAHYLRVRPEYAGFDLRCDVFAIGGFGWPRHLEDAWRPDS